MRERDNSFRQFRRLCADISEENSYIGKTSLITNYLGKGNSGGNKFTFSKTIGNIITSNETNSCKRK